MDPGEVHLAVAHDGKIDGIHVQGAHDLLVQFDCAAVRTSSGVESGLDDITWRISGLFIEISRGERAGLPESVN